MHCSLPPFTSLPLPSDAYACGRPACMQGIYLGFSRNAAAVKPEQAVHALWTEQDYEYRIYMDTAGGVRPGWWWQRPGRGVCGSR